MDWIAIVEREGHLLSVAARHDTRAAVPSCPGWDVVQLLQHMGVTHRWAETIVRERRMEPPPRPEPPSVGALDWYEAGLAQLLETFRTTDAGAELWTLDRADRTVGFWLRRQAHETTIHRVDAEQATGAVSLIDPAFAVDGIDEVLDVTVPLRARHATAAGTVHLHATDVEGEWLVRLLDGAVEIERGHAKGEAAVRGPAAELYLWLWKRVDGAGLEHFGKPEVAAELLRVSGF